MSRATGKRVRSQGTVAWAKHCRAMVTADHLPTCTEDTREVYPCAGCNPAEHRPEWERLAVEAERWLGTAPAEPAAPAGPVYEDQALW